MVEYALSELFRQDSVDKQIDISFDDVHITNSDFRGQDFELTESLCSESELKFGCCEASVLKFKISNRFGELKDKWLTVRAVLEGNTDLPFQYGIYKVYSDVPSGNKNHRNITAYDAMYDIINADVAEWYNGLEFPMTQKEFRDSFFAYFGLEQEEVELVNDGMTINKTIDTNSISGKQIITAICELNGVFGHINRGGKFEYISLAKMNWYYEPERVGKNYISCEYEDFITSAIDKLQIRQSENDVGTIVGNGNNCYVIQDNFLVYGKDAEEMQPIAEATFNKIQNILYRPFEAQLRGNPCLEVGDVVNFQTKTGEIEGYVLERTLKGIQGLRDTLTSRGVLEYKEKVNSVAKSILQLKSKTNVLERTINATKSRIEDTEKNVTQLQQTAGEISVSVETEKGVLTTKINDTAWEAALVDANGETISGLHFDFENGRFILNATGQFGGVNSGDSYIQIDGRELILYDEDEQPSVLIGYDDKSDQGTSVGSCQLGYIKFLGRLVSMTTSSLIMRFTDGLWIGNEFVTNDGIGAFVPTEKSKGIFFGSITSAEVLVYDGLEGKSVYTGESIARFG